MANKKSDAESKIDLVEGNYGSNYGFTEEGSLTS
jgi:hypothetical protein